MVWCGTASVSYLVILRQDVVHLLHLLAGDLLYDQRAVVGREQPALVFQRRTAGQRHLWVDQRTHLVLTLRHQR